MLTVALSLVLLGTAHAAPPVAATDSRIRYVGRWDTRDPAGPRCAWSASTVEIHFSGTGLDAWFAPDHNLWIKQIDGDAGSKFGSGPDGHVVLASGLTNANHTVRLVRATEAFAGPSQILKFSVSGNGQLLAARPSKHRLEVIGDSISCGYGNEGANEREHFKPETENAFLSYGDIAARDLGADFADIAWSGRKMWPDNTIPELYDLALPQDPTSKWSFPSPPPDAILINLATNDFGKDNPDEAGWTGAYEAFIQRLRAHAPAARIYVAAGSMMSDNWPPNHHSLTTLRAYLTKIVADRAAAGDRNVAIIDFGIQDGAKDGLGSDYHPSVATHRKMAAQLEARLRNDLHW